MTDEKNTVIDLSFTKDPQWIAEREKLWGPLEEILKPEIRRKELEAVRKYFFTGEQTKEYPLRDGERVGYFPLQTAEGWDYAYRDLVSLQDVFRQELEMWIFNQSSTRTPEQDLAYWDYFFGPTFEPIVRSRVPVGRAGKIVEVKLNSMRVLGAILAGFVNWVNGSYGNRPKWVERKDYLSSLFPYISNDCFTETNVSRDEWRVGMLMDSLMKLATSFNPKTPVTDPEQNREKFLEWFADSLNRGDGIPDCVKERWQKIKAGEEVE
ncbi:MAG: hypothetical protein IPM37_00360 [Hahellaceae bacterium]|jgi:hypothetical protein|nr:hypothetical protein [Hahellaceae bacterium]